MKKHLLKHNTEPAFISTSTKKNIARGFSGSKSRILFVITSETGKDISLFSAMPEEKEILFEAGSIFRILEITKGNPETVIYLEQL